MKTAVFLLANVLAQHGFAASTAEPMRNTKNDVICSTDEECGRNKHCDAGECVRDDIICYNDDECPDRWVCDMGSYICVEPTPSPVWTTPAPTEPAGCCYGDSYKANDKCAKALEQSKCESKGCAWLVTDNPEDCRVTTTETPPTPQPTEELGCCDSDSANKFLMCAAKETRDKCERSSSCHWNSGADAVCEGPSTTTTPGCCYGNPSIAYSARWMTACTGYYTERECLFNTDEDGNYRCHWEDLTEGYDCSMLWPTTTETPTEPAGCCYGDSYKANDKCLKALSQDKCESKGCAWLVTDDPEDCRQTTTETPPTPQPTEEIGCCKGTTFKSNEGCNAMLTEKTCGKKCEWVPFGELDDECAMTTTNTPTTTVEGGCCGSDKASMFDKCNEKEEKAKCERGSSCIWYADKDAVDGEAICEPPITTTEPGCCYISAYQPYSKKYQETCIDFGTEKECLFITDDEGAPRCQWEDTEEDEDCEQLWPTTTETPTEPAGCCMGDSYKANNKCLMAGTRDKCESKGCSWIVTDDPEDCRVTTTETPPTPQPTEQPGCCKGTTFKSNEGCNAMLTEKTCGKKCEWVPFGELDDECAMTTTTTPAPTQEQGCCKGDSLQSTEKCNAKESRDKCERMSSCAWVTDGDLEEDCAAPTTSAEPGCCYGNPEAAYSARWMTACIAFFTEKECLMLTDDGGAFRCFWEPLGAYEDCEQVWPTTTETPTEPAGCCYGDSYKANDKCSKASEQSKCESKGCAWLVTDDPEDCRMTTTETPTTTEMTTTAEVGCCRGETVKSNIACNEKTEKSQCERSGKCEWVKDGSLEKECLKETTPEPTTTIEPGCCDSDNLKKHAMCNGKETETQCERSADCFWTAGADADCSAPTTTGEPGCCYGNPNIAYSKRWFETCTGYLTQRECEMLEDDNGEPRCFWELLGAYEDCEQTWPTTTSTPTEPAGCCYGDSYKANDKCLKATAQDKCESKGCSWLVTEDPEDCRMTSTESATTETPGCCAGTTSKNTEMCNEKVGREQCERSDKCEFREDEDDCSWPTTTSEPWLGAEYDLPVNPYKRSSKQRRAADHKQESVLFGEGIVADTMRSTVSLSTLLMMIAAAFAAFQLYRCVALRKAGGYTKLADGEPQTPSYQSV